MPYYMKILKAVNFKIIKIVRCHKWLTVTYIKTVSDFILKCANNGEIIPDQSNLVILQAGPSCFLLVLTLSELIANTALPGGTA